LDEHGRVSECTSANIFAVTSEGIYTPPLSAGCLPGVTRGVILKELQVTGMKVEERHLTLSELYEAKSVFITSTTRELLPVSAISGRSVGQEDEARSVLQRAFSAYMASYVTDAKLKAKSLAEVEA
jgi:branched-chain amino acid aminotransferase